MRERRRKKRERERENERGGKFEIENEEKMQVRKPFGWKVRMHDDVDRSARGREREGARGAKNGVGGKADGLYFKFKSIRQWTLLVLLTHSTKERGKKKETRRSVR